jgi:hypothetical protein
VNIIFMTRNKLLNKQSKNIIPGISSPDLPPHPDVIRPCGKKCKTAGAPIDPIRFAGIRAIAFGTSNITMFSWILTQSLAAYREQGRHHAHKHTY